MTHKLSQQQIDEARKTIRPLIPLGMVVILEIVNLIKWNETYSPALEDALVKLGTAFVESDVI